MSTGGSRFSFFADIDQRLGELLASAEEQCEVGNYKFCAAEAGSFIEELTVAIDSFQNVETPEREEVFVRIDRQYAAKFYSEREKDILHSIRELRNVLLHRRRGMPPRKGTPKDGQNFLRWLSEVATWYAASEYVRRTSLAANPGDAFWRANQTFEWASAVNYGASSINDNGASRKSSVSENSWSTRSSPSAPSLSGSRMGLAILAGCFIVLFAIISLSQGNSPQPPQTAVYTPSLPQVHFDPAPSAPKYEPPPPSRAPAPPPGPPSQIIQIRGVGLAYPIVPGVRYGLDMVEGVTAYSILNGAVMLSQPNGQIDRGCSNWGFTVTVLPNSIPPTNYVAACGGRPALIRVLSINGMSVQENAPDSGQPRYRSVPGVGAPGPQNPRYRSVPGIGG